MDMGVAAVLAGLTVVLVDGRIGRAWDPAARVPGSAATESPAETCRKHTLKDLPHRPSGVADLSQVRRHPQLIIEEVPQRLDLKIAILGADNFPPALQHRGDERQSLM